MQSLNNRKDCSKMVYLHPHLRHAIASIPQELLPSMTDHTFHTNVEPENKHNISNLVCDYNHSSIIIIILQALLIDCCWLLFLFQTSTKVSFTSSSLPALIKENICFRSLASSSYNTIERCLLDDQIKSNPMNISMKN